MGIALRCVAVSLCRCFSPSLHLSFSPSLPPPPPHCTTSSLCSRDGKLPTPLCRSVPLRYPAPLDTPPSHAPVPHSSTRDAVQSRDGRGCENGAWSRYYTLSDAQVRTCTHPYCYSTRLGRDRTASGSAGFGVRVCLLLLGGGEAAWAGCANITTRPNRRVGRAKCKEMSAAL